MVTPAYLLTGQPRVGKSTLIKRLVETVGRERCGGFYTEEILEDGQRVGFRLATIDGRYGTVAHTDIASELRVSRYGIDLKCLDTLGISSITDAMTQHKLVVIDELGPIQAYSSLFQQSVTDLLNSTLPFVGTIALQQHPWLDTVKQHLRVKLCVMAADKQEETYRQMLSYLL